MSRYLVLLLVLMVVPQLYAQEIDCTVQVSYESVPTTHKDLLRDLGNDIQNYINNFQWGTDKLEDKVRCTMTVYVQNVVGENRYSAQVFVGSQRPLFGQAKNSAVLRLMDEIWEFTYIKDRPINHNPYQYNDLTSFLDYYAYLVLGSDYDTYEPLAGTPWFQKASDVARMGMSVGQKGWQPVTSGYSRTQYINDLLNPGLEPLRRASQLYHFTGLDSLKADRQKAMKNALSALEMIGKARKTIDPRNLALKAFFETKYLEIADTFLEYPDPSVYILLGRIDPVHLATYEEYRTKKR